MWGTVTQRCSPPHHDPRVRRAAAGPCVVVARWHNVIPWVAGPLHRLTLGGARRLLLILSVHRKEARRLQVEDPPSLPGD